MKKIGMVILTIMFCASISSGALGQEIKVGTLLAHTGPLEEMAPEVQNGAILAAKQLASAGFTIELIHEDSETSAIPATKAAKKLVEVDKVVAIVGAMASGVSMKVAESVTIPNSVLLISPSSTSPSLTVLEADKGKDFLFRTCPSDSLQGVVLGKLAAGLYKTASVIFVKNAYGRGLAEQFKKSFEKREGQVKAMVSHEEKAAKFYTTMLRTVFEQSYVTRSFYVSGRPDVLCVFSYPGHAKNYVKEAIEVFNYRSFLFCDGSKSMEILEAAGAENLEGMMGTAPGSPGGEPYMNFATDFRAEFGKKVPPFPFITNAYDTMAVVGLAAYAAKVKGLPLTAKNIRDHL
ncbi:MAG: ABC transporter substrate-binding protein, partial [Desulfobacterales bacterium]